MKVELKALQTAELMAGWLAEQKVVWKGMMKVELWASLMAASKADLSVGHSVVWRDSQLVDKMVWRMVGEKVAKRVDLWADLSEKLKAVS